MMSQKALAADRDAVTENVSRNEAVTLAQRTHTYSEDRQCVVFPIDNKLFSFRQQQTQFLLNVARLGLFPVNFLFALSFLRCLHLHDSLL